MKTLLARMVATLAVPLCLMLTLATRADGPPEKAPTKEPSRGERRQVAARVMGRTLVGFLKEEPKPWPNGNCFTLSSLSSEQLKTRGKAKAGDRPPEGLKVLNMHAENFEEICGRLRLTDVLVELVGDDACLIVDPRIGREWLREGPCMICIEKLRSDEVLARYPDAFRKAAH